MKIARFIIITIIALFWICLFLLPSMQHWAKHHNSIMWAATIITIPFAAYAILLIGASLFLLMMAIGCLLTSIIEGKNHFDE